MITYGLKGWYWSDPSGKLGVVYKEHVYYTPVTLKTAVHRLLGVDLKKQKELCDYHDSKASRHPKSAPITMGKYRLNKTQKEALCYWGIPLNA